MYDLWYSLTWNPKSDIKSVIKSDIRFDISIKQTTWIGHKTKIHFGLYEL